jgi:hypothetical protein
VWSVSVVARPDDGADTTAQARLRRVACAANFFPVRRE